MVLSTILLVFAFVLFVLATFKVPEPPRANLMAAGLACAALAILVGRLNLP